MVVFEIDEFLKGAGIEEIKTIGHDLIILTRVKGRFLIEIKEDEEKTGYELEKKCRALELLTIQKICLLIHRYWDRIQDEINPHSDEQGQLADDDPKRYKAKYHFEKFEEWQLKVEEKYHNLHKVYEDNKLGFIWPATEFVLAVKAILHIQEITLPSLALLIGRGGGGKTVPIQSLRGRNPTYYTDDFNPHAMVSHMVSFPKHMKEEDQHMILRIRNKLVLAPELAPMFSSGEDDLREVLAILVRIADGEGLETDSGVGHRGFSGIYQFNLIGATTEPPWYVYKLLTKLGPKLLFFRLGKTEPTHDELVKMLKGDEFVAKKKRIDAATNEYLDVFESSPNSEFEENSFLPKISLAKYKTDDDDAALDIAVYLGRLLGHLRGVVQTRELTTEDGRPSYVFDTSEIEDPRRAVEQIRNLMKGRALSQGRTSITMEDVPMAIKVTLSTAPRHRSKIFIALLQKGSGGSLSNDDLTKLLHMHHTTAKRTMTELEALRLVEMKETQTGGEQKITITLKEDPKFKWFTTKGFQEAQRIDDRRYQSFVLKGQKEAEISSANFVPREGVEDQ